MVDSLPPLHPDCAGLAFLLGTWRGGGEGSYPTIESFSYVEEVTFGHVGKPFLAYSQKTKHADTGLPLHAESGYLRAVGGNSIEFVVAQPSGILEVHAGEAVDSQLRLELVSVQLAPTALSVTDVVRRVRVDDDRLSYEIAMAAVGQPLTHHLEATLQRV